MLEATSDGWQNILTGFGDPSRDKRQASVVSATILDYDSLTELYRSTDTGKMMIERFVEEQLREWFDVVVPDDEDAAEKTGEYLDGLECKARLFDAIKWKRHYGGAAVFVGVNDGQSDPAQEVDYNNIKSVDFLTTFDPSEARVIQWQANPGDKDYGQPLYYQIFPRIFGMGAATVLQKVHASRVLRFIGPMANRWQVAQRQGWGDSVFDDTWERIRDFDQLWDSLGVLLTDASQGVFKMKGLALALSADKDKTVLKRLQTMDMARSILRMMVIDADGEDFERKDSAGLSGIGDVADKAFSRLAMAARMPKIVLMGETPKSLGGTTDNEMLGWFNTLSADQERSITPQLKKLLKLIFLAQNSPTKGKIPENFSVKWRPLWQLSDKEKADRNYTQAQADNLYVQMGAAAPLEIRTNRFEGDEYSTETRLESPEVPGFGPEPTTDPNQDPSGRPAGSADLKVNPGQPIIAGASIGAKEPSSEDLKSASPAVKGALNPSAVPSYNLGVPVGSEPAAAPKPSEQGMAGHQVSAAHELVKSSANGQIPPEALLHLLTSMLGVSPEVAQKIVDSLKNFEPKVDPMKQAELEIKSKAVEAKGLNNNANKNASPSKKKTTKDSKSKKVTKG